MFNSLKGKLIVSCQAADGEPLFGAMGKMAFAAKEGGAAAIRTEGAHDIEEIKKITGLPIIGLIKRHYPDSEVYITPTMKEAEELVKTSAEMIALDMTRRPRPDAVTAAEIISYIHAAGRLVLADVSTFEEGAEAERAGVDAVSTTLSGYTSYSPQKETPDIELVKKLAAHLNIPVFAEGRISTPEELSKVMRAGAWAAVIGSAITRPQIITKNFVQALI